MEIINPFISTYINGKLSLHHFNPICPYIDVLNPFVS